LIGTKAWAVATGFILQAERSRFTKKCMVKRTYGWLLICLVSFAACTKDSTTTEDTIGNWVRRSDFEGVGRSESITATANGIVFVGLGYDGTTRLTDFWEYDANSDFWKKKAAFPGVARSSAVAFEANGKVYAGLGYDGINSLNDFWEYDPAKDTWTRIADFGGSARYDAVAFGLNNKGYVCSGYDGNYLKDFWEYDPATNTWTQKVSPGGSKRSAAAVFVVNAKAYIVSGTNNGSYLNDLWEYDPALDKWTEKRKISDVSDETYDDDYAITRSNAVAFGIGTKGYLCTGAVGGLSSTCWEYDPTTDLWTNKTAFEGAAREGAVGFSVNNRGFVATGRSSGLRLDDMREFLPLIEYNEND